MEISEKQLERKFREAVRRAGGRAYKFISPGNAGVPDRLVVLPGGRTGFVELKRKGGKPRPDQRHQMEILEKLGCVTAVLDSADRIGAVLDAVRAGRPEEGRNHDR